MLKIIAECLQATERINQELNNLTNADWERWKDLQQLYNSYDSTQSYGLFCCIPDRGPSFEVTVLDDSSRLARLCRPVINNFQRHYKSEPISAVFSKVKERSVIPIHTDPMYRGIQRLHIPIVTHPHIWMVDENLKLHFMQRGNAYQLDALKPHGVINASRIDRIHFVIDFPVPELQKSIVKYEAQRTNI